MLGDAGAAAAARVEVALGGELRIGLDDDAAGDPELRGQRAGGGQARARGQAAAADGFAQRVLGAGAQRAAGGAGEIEMEVHLASLLHNNLVLEYGPNPPYGCHHGHLRSLRTRPCAPGPRPRRL